MLLYQWRGEVRNFGDELNGLVWPILLPGFFDEDPTSLFLGIGSVLDSRHATRATKIVAGAGYGGYQRPPVLDATWTIHWVRGPHTARKLGLPPAAGIGDPAMLLRHAGFDRAPDGNDIGFMPHFESAARGAWEAVGQSAGIKLIDPRGDPAVIIAAIGNCRVLLSEALHGVIVADTLRVPWIAIEPLVRLHRAKWFDWADSLGLRIEFHRLAASSLYERLYASAITRRHTSRTLLEVAEAPLRNLASARLIERAARTLRRAATASPQLSAAASLHACQSRMLACLESLRHAPLRGSAGIEPGAPPALPSAGKSAYHPGSVG